ncbi:serine/threonine-protein kinase [Stigmatella sp. ncwal1]|uniref:non-specific serine/threonine protein kinase n=1 Tax=Stigmatella ashevillensis TaxID=2995309 RepID=A0ABT5DEU8_9BACT|nr:serine/threonine-protein kinase [Stigmatella ashevillena]MDC0711609.1 serine/threonine-protein kinase [Stigmatella ashevillena]
MGHVSVIAHPLQLQPDMKIGPWRIVARLGSGGFGAVFRVECGGEFFALKFAVHGPDSPDPNRTDGRARRELACLLLTSHPHVVRVWGHGRWPHPRTGYHYVVMDYVEGPTLTGWVRHHRPTFRQVLVLFDTLARTLDALHAQDIHHRDLKGSNILVRAVDDAPLLVDFGAGDHADSTPLTEGPLPPGTPHLRTPEALRFLREEYANPLARYVSSPSDDLYALGGTLYEVLTGVPPFPPHLPREVLIVQIETQMPTPPAALNALIPPALSNLVQRLLAKTPEERPNSGWVLHEELEALLLDERLALDVPVAPSAEAVTTEGMGEALLMVGEDPPEGRPPPVRTSRPPWGETEAPPAAPPPAPPLGAPAPSAPTEAQAPRTSRHWTVLVLLGGLGVGLGLWRTGPSLTPDMSPSLSASPLPAEALPLPLPLPMDTGDAGPPPTSNLSDAGSAPVAAAPPRPPAPEGPPMRKKSPATPPDPPPAPGGGKTLPQLVGATVAACAIAGGCASTGSQVRLSVPREPCPPGALEAMEPFRKHNVWKDIFYVRIGDTGDYHASVNIPAPPEGPAQGVVVWPGEEGALPVNSVLLGRFYRTQRVFIGRFTEALLPDGQRLPVCYQLVHTQGSDLQNPNRVPHGWFYEEPVEARQIPSVGRASWVKQFGEAVDTSSLSLPLKRAP